MNVLVLAVASVIWWRFGPPHLFGPFPSTATWRPNPAYGFRSDIFSACLGPRSLVARALMLHVVVCVVWWCSNELILHALAPVLIAAPRLCSPGFEDKSVSDGNGNAVRGGLIPLSDMFDGTNPALRKLYDPKCSATANHTRCARLSLSLLLRLLCVCSVPVRGAVVLIDVM